MTLRLASPSTASLNRVVPEPGVVRSAHFEPGVTVRLFADGVVHLVIDEGVVIDLDAVRLVRSQLAQFVGGSYVTVGDLRQVPYVERDARTELALDDDGRVLASAVVTGTMGPIPFLVRRWLAENVVARPTEVFVDTPEALVWAHQMAAGLHAAGRLP